MEAAIDASKARHIKMWRENEGCHWVKVTEMDSGKVVGAACWNFNLEQQAMAAKKVPFNAYWHIEGSDEKAFAEKLIGGLRGFVSERVRIPNIELSQMMVHPDFRAQGAGRLLVDWGTQKASEFGVDTIVMSVPYAVPVYEKCGFGVIEQIDIDFTVPSPSKKWKEYQSEDLRTFLMWKPAGRTFQIGDKAPCASEL
ncbi:hypothetical protein K505DRAFT_311616 [Melanomma pulvis-pyrius CBS 109.77]|uniref:N-acetyltransferase domain-containing protein n=1 Tax=Melanomma pulvis-pyrius CBS 109.77 TaxID=1314802 RepID=A0A6A6X270_9PLEO|nr:hypothetical protein K505DRAFT_311616 [Melanomma pulvis-pyrius CBS 109.77]